MYAHSIKRSFWKSGLCLFLAASCCLAPADAKKKKDSGEAPPAATGSPTPELMIAKDSGGAFAPIAFSPNSQLIASGGSDHTIRIWDIGSSKLLRILHGTSTQINGMCFSPDSKTLACANYDNTIALFDIATGEQTVTLKGHKKQVNTVWYSADGKTLASGADDETVRLWDLTTNTQTKQFGGKVGSIRQVYFSPDGQKIIASTDHKSVRVWNIASGKQTSNLVDAYSPIVLTPDGSQLACRGKGETLDFWDWDAGKKVKTLDGHFPKTKNRVRRASILAVIVDQTVTLGLMGKKLSYNGNRDKNSMTISPDGKTIVTGSLDNGGGGNMIAVWDTQTGAVTNTVPQDKDWVNSVRFSPDGKLLASSSGDKTIHLWNIATAEKAATLVTVEGDEWDVIAPDGRFDGSQEGMKRLYWNQNDTKVPLDAFFDKFYTPHLLARVAAGGELPKPSVVIVNGFKLPPTVRITSPVTGASFDKGTAEVTVEATDEGGGVQDIQLFQNGKRVVDDTKKIIEVTASKTITRTFNVALVPGTNTIRACAFNSDRTQSNPAEIAIGLTSGVVGTDLYVLAVGIDTYKNPMFQLAYCKDDAQSFMNALITRGKTIFHTMHTTILPNDKATKPQIEAAFAAIKAQAKPTDAFVFYYSGHGDMIEGQPGVKDDFYLVCQDVLHIDGDNGLAIRGLSSTRLKELSSQISAQKQLFVLDACYSGGALQAFGSKGLGEEKAIAQLARSSGTVVLTAASKSQEASVITQLHHSVFTYALLQGMSGEADQPPDGRVTVNKLKVYLDDKLPELTQKFHSQAQYPQCYSIGQDFPIGVH